MKINEEKKRTIKGLASMATVIIIILLLCCSCFSFKRAYTSNYGEVISVDGDKVEVIFMVLNYRDEYLTNVFYHQGGHGYSVGDTYPDFSKQNYQPFVLKEIR